MSYTLGITLAVDGRQFHGEMRLSTEEVNAFRAASEAAARDAAGTARQMDGMGAAANELTRDVDRLARGTAQAAREAGELGTASRTSAQALTALARGVDELEASIDPVVAAGQRLRRQTELLDEALKRGRIGQERYVEILAKARAAHDQAVESVQRLSRGHEEAARQTAAVSTASATSAQALAQLATQVDELHGRLDPVVGAAQRLRQQTELLDQALKRGRITQERYNEILGKAKASYQAAVEATGRFGAASQTAAQQVGFTRNQILTLQYTINDVVASLASGASPFTILMQQGGQVTQAFGGLRETAAALGPSLLGVGAAVGATAVAVVTLVAAHESHAASVRRVLIANAAMGDRLGLTGAQLEAMARTSAEAGDLSVRAAREMQAAYVSAGRIGAEVMADLIGLTRDYAAATEQDLTEASADLARLFSDPARGAETLAQRFDLLSDAQLQHVRTLAMQGERTQAQTVLAEALSRRISGLGDNVGILTRAWRATAQAASDAWDAMGRVGAGPSPEQRLAEAQARVARLQERAAARRAGDLSGYGDPGARALRDAELRSRPGGAGGLTPTERAELEEAQRERDALIQENTDRARRARARENLSAGRAAGEVARSVDPLYQTRSELDARISALQKGQSTADPNAQVAEQFERLTNARRTLLTETEKSIRLADAEVKAATMVGVERERYLAQARTEISLSGQQLTTKERRQAVDAAVAQATAAHTQQVALLNRQLDLQVDAQIRLAEAAGKGEAAMRAANLENQVAAAAARSVAEGAATRAALERQEQETVRQIRAEATAEIERQTEANRRLAKAIEAGPAAAKDAEIAAEAHALALREGAEGTEAFNAAYEHYLKLLRQRSASDDAVQLSAMVDAQRDKLDLARQEAALVGLAPEARAREIAKLEAINELKRKGIDLSSEQAKEYVRNAEALGVMKHRTEEAERQAELLDEPFKEAARSIQNALAGAFEDVLSGNVRKFSDLAAIIRGIFIKLAAQLAALLVFQPTVGSVLTSGVGQAAGQAGGGLGSLFGGGSSPFSLSNLSSFANIGQSQWFTQMWNGGILANNATVAGWGASLGFSPAAAATPDLLAGAGLGMGGGTGAAGSAAAASGFGTALGAAGGAIGGGLIGYQTGSPVMGGLSGAAMGFALGGPIGAGVGAIAGIAGGLFGRSAQRRAARDKAEVERQGQIAQLVPALHEFYELAGEPMTQTGKALSDLTKRFNELSSQAKALGLDTSLLSDSFDKAKKRIRDEFSKSIDDAILAIENNAKLAMQQLEEAHRRRIDEAIDAEVDLEKVRRLNALETKRFLEGLTSAQLEGLGQAVHLADVLSAKLRELAQGVAGELEAQVQLSAAAEGAARQAAEAFRAVAQSLREAVRQLRGGELSTLSSRDKLAEQRAAFEQAASAALAGDQAAMANLPALAQALLQASEAFNGSTVAYATDFDRVMAVLQAAGVSADAQAARQQTQAEVLRVQTELLRKIQAELSKAEGPNAAILRGQLQTLAVIDGVLKGTANLTVEQLVQMAGVSAGERTIAEQIASGNSRIAGLLEEFLKVQEQERLERQRKAAEEAARQARQAQIDAQAAAARGKAASLSGQIAGVRSAGATGNLELAVQAFDPSTGQVTGTGSDRGEAQFDRANALREILTGFAQQLASITGGTLPANASVYAATKYGSGYAIGNVNRAHSFGINDFQGIVTTFVRDAAQQLAGITPELRDAIAQISWTNLPAAFDQLQREVLRLRGYATGTPSAPPGWAWVGEEGPELMRMQGGEQILPHGLSMRVAGEAATLSAAPPARPRAAPADRGLEARIEILTEEVRALRQDNDRLAKAQIATTAEGARRVEGAVQDNTAQARRVERAVDRQAQAALVK